MDIEINESAVAIVAIGTVHDALRVPPGVQSMKGGIALEELNDWLKGRSIPTSRAGIRDLYARLGRESTEYLILKCYALSLSDHYWLCLKGSAVNWSDMNFFENDFSRDVGEMLFGHEPADRKRINLMSPDNTSDGWLKKKWIIADGNRKLVKGGSEPWRQEPYNEVIASVIMRRLEIPHVPYTLTFDDGEPLCVCDNFLSVETELITEWKVFHSQRMRDSDSDFTHFLRCCDSLGIVGIQSEIDKMLVLDYIIANEDRHYNNFGFVRNADTLEWVGFAPIFVCGTSLWHNSFDIGGQRKCQPFNQSHEEQLKLVSDLNWFDTDALKGVDREITEIFSRSPVIDKARCNAITTEVLKRADAVGQMKRELYYKELTLR
jgi:hypothetical protein